MANKGFNPGRRHFLRAASATGLASVLAAKGLADTSVPAAAEGVVVAAKEPILPRRELGKTKLKVSILNHGVMYDTTGSQLVLQKTVDLGINFIDTAYGYGNGKSEVGLGMFFKENPAVREKVIIVSKASGAKNVADMESRLQTSLERIGTKYLDVYYMHGISRPGELSEEMRKWAASAKERGLIRFFGFSTHQRMTEMLAHAAGLDWIDVIMPSYHFRLMQDAAYNKAIDACYKAGIGLVAMKVMARGVDADTPADRLLLDRFIKQGYTIEQAKHKVVWQDERFAAVCSRMPSIAMLTANYAAAIDKTKLSEEDMKAFTAAASDCTGWCAACSRCGGEESYIPQVMRCLMYSKSYGEPQMARETFAAEVPAWFRQRMASGDFAAAEAHCPNGLAIGRLMREAAELLV